jgi:hypothetical protein
MSNHLAIATVTAALQSLLQEAAEAAVAGAQAQVGRPESPENGAEQAAAINIFLYRVAPNAAWRNADLPNRRPDGSLVERHQTALDLHYLLTFLGDEAQLEPQRLLGSAASTLNVEPLLSRARIRATIQAAVGADPTHFLGASDLAEQVETVRFTPLPLNLEELSKLWSVFFQIPYSLSTAYQASVVLVESSQSPQRALPVRARRLYVRPFRQPLIEKVASEAGDLAPITSNSTLVISGHRLRGDLTRVLAGGILVTPADEDVREDEIRLPLPAGVLAGVQGVQVLHPLLMGEPEAEHAGFESNTAPLVVSPLITVDSATAAQVVLNFDPPVGRRQRVLLLLNEHLAPPTRAPFAYSFKAPPDNGIADPDADQTAEVAFPISGVTSGSYLARAQVDGAQSPLTFDDDDSSPTFNLYNGPLAVIP